MHVIAHEGGTDTVRESALQVDSRRKISCRSRGLEPASVLRLAFQSDALPTELFPTLFIIIIVFCILSDTFDTFVTKLYTRLLTPLLEKRAPLTKYV